MSNLYAFAIGQTRTDSSNNPLESYFPLPLKTPEPELAKLIVEQFEPGSQLVAAEAIERFLADAGEPLASSVGPLLAADQPLTVVRLDEDGPINSVPEAYLKLHLLSHRLALPNSQNLDNIFVQGILAAYWDVYETVGLNLYTDYQYLQDL